LGRVEPQVNMGNGILVEKGINTWTYWQLIYRRFKKHRLATISFYILVLIYSVGLLAPGFFAPYNKLTQFEDIYLPPQAIKFIDEEGNFHIRPFTYEWKTERNPDTWTAVCRLDKSFRYPLYFFVRGEEYKLLGLFKSDIHLFGVKDANLFLFGTDNLGRDLFSRIIYGTGISLSIGLVGVGISFFLGLLLGGLSGLIGGVVDNLIQRSIEFIKSIPSIPLWMALAAAIPQNWSALKVYFMITIILSFTNWTGLARVIRSNVLSIKERDFIKAAESFNAPVSYIITKHLLPNMMSYIIVGLTLAVPSMILGETSLSFLGIGLRPPVVSLGVLLQNAQSFQAVSMYPWILIPGIIVTVVILSLNFVGDGMRDAADPYYK